MFRVSPSEGGRVRVNAKRRDNNTGSTIKNQIQALAKKSAGRKEHLFIGGECQGREVHSFGK